MSSGVETSPDARSYSEKSRDSSTSLGMTKDEKSKHQRNQRRTMAVASRKVCRLFQGNFRSARTRTCLARFVQATSLRSGMESHAFWQTKFSLSRTLGAMGALSDYFG